MPSHEMNCIKILYRRRYLHLKSSLPKANLLDLSRRNNARQEQFTQKKKRKLLALPYFFI